MIKEIRNNKELKLINEDVGILIIKDMGKGNFIIESENKILYGYFKVPACETILPRLKLNYDFDKVNNRKKRKNQKIFCNDRDWFKYILEKYNFIKHYDKCKIEE